MLGEGLDECFHFVRFFLRIRGLRLRVKRGVGVSWLSGKVFSMDLPLISGFPVVLRPYFEHLT